MFYSRLKWIVPTALTLATFGAAGKSAIAQTPYNFSVTYDTTVTIVPTNTPNIVRATITGESKDAPYGLTSFISDDYGLTNTDPVTNITKTTFNSDPTVFGLVGQQVFSDRYYGGANELFGKASDSAEINPAAGTIQGGGTITIFNGTGIFQNATGQIAFTEADQLTDPTVPAKGQALLKFSLQVPQKVPEATPNIALIGMGMVGSTFVFCKHRRKVTSG
ncbi:MAG: hypothetical protein PUP91_12905 [Rhizonema sp. PD37]|nr:hypothetical protein [Rhizonema sp. PD37]